MRLHSLAAQLGLKHDQEDVSAAACDLEGLSNSQLRALLGAFGWVTKGKRSRLLEAAKALANVPALWGRFGID